VVGLVHLKWGHRCRFYNCEFIGLDTFKGDTGVAIWLEVGGGTTIINSRNFGNGGALIKCSESGEMVMINCRCEGAHNVPSFDFQKSNHITLIGLTNEGKRENPAVFRFTNCFNIVALNPGLATTDSYYSGKYFQNPNDPNNWIDARQYADGMLLDNCTEFSVIQPVTTASFAQAGNNAARAIRIKGNCRYGVVKGWHVKHHATDTDIAIEPEAKACFVEAFSAGRGHTDPDTGTWTGGLVGIGTLVADGLRGSPAFNAPNSYTPRHPMGYDLEIGGGDSAKPGTYLAGNTIIQLGKPAGGNTAQLLFSGGSSLFSVDDFIDLSSFVDKLRTHQDPISNYLWQQFSPETQAVLASTTATPKEQTLALVKALNKILKGHLIYDSQRFAGVALSPETLALISQSPIGADRIRLNRLLLDAAYPLEIAKSAPVIGRIWYEANKHLKIASVDTGLCLHSDSDFVLEHGGISRISFDGTGLAFNDKTPIAKPIVTGSHGGNAALASLLSALSLLGLITDATTT
jgi:hypothetical protein